MLDQLTPAIAGLHHKPTLAGIKLRQVAPGQWAIPTMAGGDSALDDKVRDITKAIETKTTEAKTAWADFEKHRKTLAEADPDEIDITNPEDPLVKAADEAMKPYSKAADELAVLHAQREKFWAMTGEKGKHLNPEQREQQEQIKDLINSVYTIGASTVGSERYKALQESGLFKDDDSRPVNVQLGEPMDAKHFKSLLTGAAPAAGGSLLEPNRLPGLVDIPQIPLNIFQLLTIGQTGERSVEYIRMLSRTIRAAEVAEAITSADIGSGNPVITSRQAGLKPESDLTFEKDTASVATIAHGMPATRNMLADAPFLETLIDSELRMGAERRLELQTVRGDGLQDNIRGILETPGILSYNQGTVDATEPKVDAMHRSLTMLRLQGFEPSAFAQNPLDWEDIRLSKDLNNNYIWGPPSQAGPAQCWGKPVVPTIAVPEGVTISAEWARILLLIREAVKVLASDSHKDWFFRNLIALLAELRAVLIVMRPQCICEITFD